jgi:viroplasmin and RNaseH domain-containing protein
VYGSWGFCSEYALGFSGAAYKSYFTRLEADAAYANFLNSRTKIVRLNTLPNSSIGKIY